LVATRLVEKKLVDVAFVEVELVMINPVANKLVEVAKVLDAKVPWRMVEKKFVEVAFVVVELVAMKLVANALVEVELVLDAFVPCKVVVKKVVVVAPVAAMLMVLKRPVLEMEKSVVVAVSLLDDEMLKTSGLIGEEDARKMEKLAIGEVVPSPTLPSGSMRKSVAEDEPIANGMVVPDALTASVENGEVVPMPTFEAKVLLTVVEVETK